MLISRSGSFLAFFFLFVIAPVIAQSDGTVSPGGAKNDGQLRKSISRPDESSKPDNPASEPPPPPIALDAPRIGKETRLKIVGDFQLQLVYARTAFPMGTKGLLLKEGVVTPSGEQLQQMLNLWGPAVKAGDPAHISVVQIKGDHIHFEINGGPILRKKWYQRIEVSGANGPVTQTDAPQNNPHGSYVDLYFDNYVPEMTTAQLRELLRPVLDFHARNKEQAYLDTVPPKAKAAIQAHHVLVGMNQEMVLHAKGKPPRKVREREADTQYEEWIYGEAPADVDFVRFVGDEVVRVETMRVNGEKIVRTEKEIILQPAETDADQEAKKEPEDRPATAPSLRRPGEDAGEVPGPANGAAPTMPVPPPDLPQPPGGPGQFRAAR